MIALIDGDLVAYRCAASCEPTKAKAFLEAKEVAIFRAEDLIRRILHETEADQYRMFIGGAENFRYQIYPDYKGNRPDTKPTWLQDVREYLVVEHKAVISDGIESDDSMGIEQCCSEFMTTVICTNDKDLKMIPGNHYNPITGESLFVSPLDGLKYFYQQLIQGDQSDNIPGYDGKMRPKIPKFLQGHIDALWSKDNEQDMYWFVLDMYKGDEKTLHRNAQLLWIQRKEGDVWRPPHERQDEESN